MKKNNFIYALLGAIALAGAGGLSSCAETEEEAKVNPGYNPQTGDVPVKFMFNISTGSTTSSTRMSEGNVQATTSNTFRGMDQTALLSFKLASDGKHVTDAVIADKLYGLGPILGTNAIGPDSKDKSRRILELTLPVGTNAMMFWGKATKNGTDDQQGKLNVTLSQNLNETVFKLIKRVPDGNDPTEGYNKAALTNYKTLIETILNTIVQTKYSGTSTYTSSGNSQSKEVTDLSWAEYGTVGTGDSKILKIKVSPTETYEGDPDPSNPNESKMCALGETLSKEFVVLNTIYPNEMRAGSGPAVHEVLSTLFSVINSVATAVPTNIEEAIAKDLAVEIRKNILKALNPSGSGFQKINTIKTNLGLTALQLPSGNDELINFPSIFGIPEGGTILSYDVATNEYQYRSSLPTYNMGGGDSFNPDHYVYPPELCYFGNSPIRVADSEDDSIFPEGSVNWDNWAENGPWSAWSSDQSVKSSTNSVAMKYNINYGTALLKTQVKYSADELQDNRAALILEREGATEANQTIDAKTKQPFALTGILIGGQNYEVGWNYLTDGNGSFSAYLYDRDLSTTQQAIPSNGEGSSNPVYTLVWDNWDPAKADQDQHPIFIGLEFKNNSGKAFWGQNNLIPVNGTFYITGMLDPDYASPELLTRLNKTADEFKEDKTLGITWPTKYALPPYDANGNTIQERRVFIQDFMTEATFVIGPTSLQKALVAVPDLRSAHLSVGLSVDLNWSTGLNFADIMLGGTGN